MDEIFVIERQVVPGRHWGVHRSRCWDSFGRNNFKAVVGCSFPEMQEIADRMNANPKKDPPQKRFRVAAYGRVRLPGSGL